MSVSFSVIIPLYNKAPYVLDTIQGVFNQTYTDYEVIVVNDCSTDNSAELVKGLKDSRIKLLAHKENLGLSATRNTGIAAATHEYIAFLDADDCWKPNFLMEISSLIKLFPEQKAFATYFEENFHEKILNPKNKLSKSLKGKSFVIENFFKINIGRLILTQSCLVVHKDALATIDGYDSKITFAEDIDFFARFFSKYDLAYAFKVCHMQNTTISKSLTQSGTRGKTYPDLTKYLRKSADLDAFVYFYMYCFCQRLKTENRTSEVRELRNKINLKSLNLFQVILIYLPQPLYMLIRKFKDVLIGLGFQPNTY